MKHREQLRRRVSRRSVLAVPPLVAAAVIATAAPAQADAFVVECVADLWGKP